MNHCSHNFAEACIKIRDSHNIDIVISREPSNPRLKDLEERIKMIEDIGINFDDIDDLITSRLDNMDIVTKAYLASLLEPYATNDDVEALKSLMIDMLAQEREYNKATYLTKKFISEEDYNNLQESEREANTIYVI